MSYNRHLPHLFIIPEDDNDRKIANGFIKHIGVNQRSVQVLSPQRGWSKTVDEFVRNHATQMRTFIERRVLLLIDFDNHPDRAEKIHQKLPNDLKERVFILGVISEPELLKKYARQGFESIGESLAVGCPDHKSDVWDLGTAPKSRRLRRHMDSEITSRHHR